MKKTKLIPFYFPQFHSIPENDNWWGKGYTDWERVKNANPLFDAHHQPRIPVNSNYYNLASEEVIAWQVETAQQYGLSGFCFYHYWFDGKLLLEKPMEIFYKLKHDFPYCVTWANETWTKRWIGSNEILIQQTHKPDTELWKRHFDYLLKFFEDKRSIRIDGKPVFLIYRPDIIQNLDAFIDYFRTLAAKNGLGDLYMIGIKSYNTLGDVYNKFDAILKFQPRQLFNEVFFKKSAVGKKIEAMLRSLPERIQLPIGELKYRLEKYKVFEYDAFWEETIQQAVADKQSLQPVYHSGLVDWDNTARYGKKAKLFRGSSPENFKQYLEKLIQVEDDKANPMIFINAWNEWSEGAYLEPDTKHGYSYLEGIRQLSV